MEFSCADFNLSVLHDFLVKECGAGFSSLLESSLGELRCFVNSKLKYLDEESKRVQASIGENERVGVRILKQLEDNLNVTLLELDKYKLLVSESDVIAGLLLKLCNKMAMLENVIECMGLAVGSREGKEKEVEVLRQELSQTVRKKEEALFLKNGIDKRAALVSDFLLK